MSMSVDLGNPVIAHWRVAAAAQAGLDAMRPEIADMLFGRGNPRSLSALPPSVRAVLMADVATMLLAAFPDWETVFRYGQDGLDTAREPR